MVAIGPIVVRGKLAVPRYTRCKVAGNFKLKLITRGTAVRWCHRDRPAANLGATAAGVRAAGEIGVLTLDAVHRARSSTACDEFLGCRTSTAAEKCFIYLIAFPPFLATTTGCIALLEQGPVVEVAVHGASVCCARHVFFGHWACKAIADDISVNPASATFSSASARLAAWFPDSPISGNTVHRTVTGVAGGNVKGVWAQGARAFNGALTNFVAVAACGTALAPVVELRDYALWSLGSIFVMGARGRIHAVLGFLVSRTSFATECRRDETLPVRTGLSNAARDGARAPIRPVGHNAVNSAVLIGAFLNVFRRWARNSAEVLRSCFAAGAAAHTSAASAITTAPAFPVADHTVDGALPSVANLSFVHISAGCTIVKRR